MQLGVHKEHEENTTKNTKKILITARKRTGIRMPFYESLPKLRHVMPFSEEEIIKIILDEAFYLHKSLGPGLLEKVYSTCLAYLLRKKGLYVETERPIPIIYEDVKMDCGYRADLVVENRVVVETKSVEAIASIHVSQVLTHLRFLDLRYGLLLNFNTVYLKDGIKRVLNGF